MTTAAGNGTVHIMDNEEIESVQDFLFLGSKIVCSGDSRPDINRRIARDAKNGKLLEANILSLQQRPE